MKNSIVADGFHRLVYSPWYRQKREIIEAHVRATHAAELAAASDYWEKVSIQTKMAREIKQELRNIASPYSLW